MKKALLAAVAGFLGISSVMASTLTIGGGRFHLEGRLVVDQCRVQPGAVLSGAGELDGSVSIAGTVTPGVQGVDDAATLSISSNLVFLSPAVYACYAAAHSNLDLISVGGAVSGTGTVNLSRHTNAIPLGQVIVDGAVASTYAAFQLDAGDTTDWRLDGNASGDLLITHLTGDTDGDHLPDFWEQDNYGNRTNAEYTADSDGDGMSSWGEFRAGTQPTNDLSLLQMHAEDPLTNTQLVISWDSVSNRSYTLWSMTNLLTHTQVRVASNLAATPPENFYTNDITGNMRTYYRVEVE